MTPDLSALPDATALLVNVVLVLGVLVASVRGWFSSRGRARRRPSGKDHPARGRTERAQAEDGMMMRMLASVLADRSATANLASATRDIARTLERLADSVDRIERRFGAGAGA